MQTSLPTLTCLLLTSTDDSDDDLSDVTEPVHCTAVAMPAHLHLDSLLNPWRQVHNL